MSPASNKQRDIAIDLVKMLAVFLIINSHADVCYPERLKILATGGAIGDVLFLFASGYTLFLGKTLTGFSQWYKRRIQRIYPSVFVCAVMFAVLTLCSQISISAFVGKEFIRAIMVYYVLLYLIRRYALERVPWILALTAAVALVVYVFWFPYKYETGVKGLYGIKTLYRWIPYFGFMLLGAWAGLHRERLRCRTWADLAGLGLSLTAFYGIQMAAKITPPVAPLQIVTLLPLAGIVWYLYKVCHAPWLTRCYRHRWGHAFIMTTGGLCLESYLIQYAVLTGRLNFLFPLNLPIVAVMVLVAAYVCRCLARLFSQTFGESNYDWRAVVKVY